MANSFVTVTSEGELAWLRLNDPARRNALDAGRAAEISDAVAASGARVIVLTGGTEAFCAGGDLDELERWSNAGEEEIGEHLYRSFQGMIRAIRASDAIVIAAIGGAAVGAGLDLALACDLRVASSAARLGQVWVRLGVIPGTGGAFLTQYLAGPTVAAQLLLTGELIDAAQALDAGLVNAVVPPESLLDEARALAERILVHPRDGVVANKRALVAASEPALESALEHARRVQPGRFRSQEFKEALRRSRRRPGP